MRAAEEKAVEDQERAKNRFREWVRTKVPDAEYMNICSGPQVSASASFRAFPSASNRRPFSIRSGSCQ